MDHMTVSWYYNSSILLQNKFNIVGLSLFNRVTDGRKSKGL